MNEFFKRIREQIVQIWSRMNRGQRIGAVASLGILVLALGLVLFTASRPEKHTLYTGLTAEDAQAVTKDLAARGVRYEVVNGADGTNIMVYGSTKGLDEIKMDLAAKGVPKQGGIGWEFLDKNEFGTTDAHFQEERQHAMETELARTIMTLEPIRSARVALAQPKDSVFVEEQQEPTASVALQLKPGESLTANQVSAITNLVAYAVPKLKPTNVSVVDNNGNLLSSADNQMPMGLTAKQWEIQHNYQQQLQRTVQSQLDRVFGPNHAIARVGVEMDFSKKKEDSEIYGKVGTPVSTQTKQESYEGGQVTPGGPNGSTSNIPSYPGLVGQGPSDYRQTQNIVNNDVNKTVTQKEKSPAEVKKITVGVLLDDSLHLGTAKIRDLQAELALAAGFDPNEHNPDGSLKGLVEVKTMPFLAPPEAPQKEEPWWLKYLPLLLLVLIAFVTFLMLGAMLQPKRQIPARAPRKAVITPAAALPTPPIGAAASVAIPAGAMAGGGITPLMGGMPGPGAIPVTSGAETPRGFWESLEEQREEAERRLLSDIETALQDSPKVSADLLRTWMKSDRGVELRERGRA